MTKGLFVFVFGMLSWGWTSASSVRGLIPAPAGTEIQLYSMRQHKSESLGSTTLGKDSIFLMPMPTNAYHGFYLLRWKGKEMEFLYDGQAISFRLQAGDKLEVLRGQQWMRYREQKQLLSALRKKEASIDSQLNNMPTTAFGYDKVTRKKKRNLRKQNKLHKSLHKEKDQLWSRTLAFEWHWLGRSGSDLRQMFGGDSLLQLLPLHDTLALYHNRWPGFVRMYFAAYAPVDSQPLAPLLLQCSQQLLAKAKQHPAYLAGTIDFLQWGIEQFNAPEAMQFLAKEKALYLGCYNTALPQQHRLFTSPLQAKQKRPPLESLQQLAALSAAELQEPRVYVFWSAECPPCVIEFDQFHRWLKHNRPEIKVTAIALQNNSSSWKADKQAFDSWNHYIDSSAWEGQLARDWQVMRLPHFVITNAAGEITAVFDETSALRKALEREAIR